MGLPVTPSSHPTPLLHTSNGIRDLPDGIARAATGNVTRRCLRSKLPCLAKRVRARPYPCYRTGSLHPNACMLQRLSSNAHMRSTVSCVCVLARLTIIGVHTHSSAGGPVHSAGSPRDLLTHSHGAVYICWSPNANATRSRTEINRSRTGAIRSRTGV